MAKKSDADETRRLRQLARATALLEAGYAKFRVTKCLDRSPRSAHMFALSLRLEEDEEPMSVEEIIITLEGRLPPYWL